MSHSTKSIMDRIKGMGKIGSGDVRRVKKEPVLVVGENADQDRYWAILDQGVLTFPGGSVDALLEIGAGKSVYIIGGPISTEEEGWGDIKCQK